MLRFSCERNVFDEPEFAEIEWLAELRSIGYGDLSDFLARRQAPKHRRHIKELLERYGCADLEKLRGFRFANHPQHPISEKRLELLSALVQRRLKQLLA